ncbi:MAG: tetratricopeptide repeat protein [Candidatus Hodarchaeota archaeon]
MRISMHPELEQGWRLNVEGKFEEALEEITDFEKLEDLTLEDKHYYRILKGYNFFGMGKLQESLRIAEQDYQENKSQNRSLYLIDSIMLKFLTLFMIGGSDSPFNPDSEIREDVLLSEKLLKSIRQESSIEVTLRKGSLAFMKGYIFYWEQNFDKAIEQHKRSLDILENYDIVRSGLIPINLHILGLSYAAKGELDLSLEAHKKSLDLFKGSTMGIDMARGVTYNSIGDIYFQKGVLDQAIRSFEKSLKLMEQHTYPNSIWWSGYSFDSLIKVFLFKDSFEEAQEYLNRFDQYLDKHKIPKNFWWYRLSLARVLGSHSRVRDRAKAEKIAKEFLEDLAFGAYFYTNTLIFLCELYFQELKASNDLEILEDIQPLVDKLIKESERSNSFSLRAHALLLKGNISLLRLNMGDARRYLTEAQQIADSHNLQLLARDISYQHDRLLEQLEGLESYKKKKLTMSERIDLASLDDTLDLMQGRRAVNAPNLIDEEPVLLLILAGGGFLLFSYPFSDEVKVEDELFGGFLSAITSFSDEALSEGLDRAKFGQYMVLMRNIKDFSFCYLFKGQSYVAQKKLFNFIENFQKNTSMMQTLKKFNQTSQVMELKDFPFLEGFIKGIFTNS